ncbi:hypothetical protein PF005_g22536 [Phytophthora fragariae]|uniref:Uncharacterized protein n=2 Tax=Phytophthora TaxID=4783 RepID=A0A6A3INH3_9STRA|nr:hypothetical protein PF003_g24213 [Phytophthora fragariae]KAE8993028.1 hypothetical protein PR002_g20360 [Phytophthora rubi]KAE8926535.1 hypothetical protein PF009_g23272 [Phytophthora fragariae]KAE8983610.1 hypothetical protein PF011_g21108 [Phytophthora fragariae]KAE8997410.1 hypothetical protein PR001_g19586 [Phytophthora rubi]
MLKDLVEPDYYVLLGVPRTRVNRVEMIWMWR